MKILLSRIDNIGDVILALPLVGVIKQYFPTAQVYFLARSYAQAIITCAPQVDGFFNWDEVMEKSLTHVAEVLKKEQFNIFINLSEHKLPSRLAKMAKIPQRIATARRLYHLWYCNKHVWVNRRSSPLHEMQMNAKLLKPLGLPTRFSTDELVSYLSLKIPPLPEWLKEYIDLQRFNLILHPGSNGNTREWPIDYYARLIKMLPSSQFNIIITGGSKEEELIAPLLREAHPVKNLVGKTTLSELISLIANVNGLVAASTGPLHLAAVLGIHTLGLYPNMWVARPGRWKPIGKNAHYLMHPERCQEKCTRHLCLGVCMQAIEVALVKSKIMEWYGK